MIEFRIFGALLVGAIAWGCSEKDDSDDESQAPVYSETEEEREARLAEQAEFDKMRAEEEAARLKAKEEKEAYCVEWAALSCKANFGCHPELTLEMMERCESVQRVKCNARMSPGWDKDAAAKCFEKASEYDCSIPLDEFFSENCGDVLGDGLALEGESCRATVSCAEGLYCEKGSERGSCNGTCARPVGYGGDCSKFDCEPELACVWGTNVDGFKAATCSVPSNQIEEKTCAPHQFLSEDDGTCRSQALPGGNCGGLYSVPCINSYCRDDDICAPVTTTIGAGCSDQSDCLASGSRCLAENDGSNARCTGGYRTCYDEHPLTLH